MEVFLKIINELQTLTIFTEGFILETCLSGVFLVNFKHQSYVFLVFRLLAFWFSSHHDFFHLRILLLQLSQLLYIRCYCYEQERNGSILLSFFMPLLFYNLYYYLYYYFTHHFLHYLRL